MWNEYKMNMKGIKNEYNEYKMNTKCFWNLKDKQKYEIIFVTRKRKKIDKKENFRLARWKNKQNFSLLSYIFQTHAIIKKGQLFVLIFHSSSLLQISWRSL